MRSVGRLRWSPLAVLVSALALGCGRTEDAGPYGSEEVVFRSHSLGALYGLDYDPPPHVKLVSPDEIDDADRPLFGGDVESWPEPPSIEEVVRMIRERIEPAFWRDDPRADIRPSGGCALVVRATESIHDEISALLQELQDDLCGPVGEAASR